MPLHSISLFSGYHRISAHLADLPVEIIHKIFSDIQLSKLLALLCVAPNPYLDACVSSHIDLGRLFPEPDLLNVKRYFTIYLRTFQRRRSHERVGEIYLLDTDAQVLLQKNKSVSSKDICSAILLAINGEISKYQETLPIYQEYHTEQKTGILIPPFHSWNTTTAEESEYIVDALFDAVDGLKQFQQDQLLKFAALIRDHHHMLKTVDDPSQEGRTDSHKSHLISQFEYLAQEAIKPWCKPIRSLFSGRVFPLIPYDRYLCLFHKTIKRWPQPKHQYPSQLQIVLDGIEYVSPRRGVPLLGVESARVKRTTQGGLGGPTFNAPNTLHDGSKSPLNAYRPWPEAEFEWLEAFIAICGYMSAMQERWYRSPNMSDTVADFWKKHLVALK